MIEKKIKKFYNSVPVREPMPVSEYVKKSTPFPFAWITAGLVIGITVILGVFLMMKDDATASESD